VSRCRTRRPLTNWEAGARVSDESGTRTQWQRSASCISAPTCTKSNVVGACRCDSVAIRPCRECDPHRARILDTAQSDPSSMHSSTAQRMPLTMALAMTLATTSFTRNPYA
jgi:hypothetical protein